jgi:hypothetical protein
VFITFFLQERGSFLQGNGGRKKGRKEGRRKERERAARGIIAFHVQNTVVQTELALLWVLNKISSEKDV